MPEKVWAYCKGCEKNRDFHFAYDHVSNIEDVVKRGATPRKMRIFRCPQCLEECDEGSVPKPKLEALDRIKARQLRAT
ncbi:MAG: hypothetical protein LiPW15_120 [Parcubacteria group bacterium LiPW_15]|nr:MAG: hypothetical protein LiPW15_120 [Parcubacteria group bacterium LiPW_15]